MADPDRAERDAAPFLRACRRLPTRHTPVWFMRQAGRSLPEYRAARGSGSISEAIRDPDLAAEITLQPVRRHGVDAAILFSDIVTPLDAVGFGVEVVPGVGPVVAEPVRSAADLDRLRPLEPPVDMPHVTETVARVVAELGDTPLIGFAGAPFTLASYLVEGRPSRTYARTKALMLGDPGLWGRLLERLASIAAASLRAQVGAGATAVQLFDSWAGALSPDDYERHVLPASRSVLEAVADLGVPRIHFGVGTAELLPLMRDAGADVVGVDWRTPLDAARARLGPGTAVQGNLDPASCLAPFDVVAERARDVLRRGGGTGHVFNLGHGVLPETDPGVLTALVDLVHEETGATGR
ncbi:MAG: uroporphyrinogen decarboxylase [Acidimicrobiia bacterium]|nr:uroporphyrinogen decarboxylase [Acidimicrobiia bacterium]MCL4293132.1 uroporphyrinogen decarboxylase [Acidimicrobiia bacterium]